jgi:hypothetical protein
MPKKSPKRAPARRLAVPAARQQRSKGAPRGPGKRFQPGQSGNPAGRPVGSRSRLSEAFLADFCEAWSNHGAAALEWTAKHDRPTFVRVAAALLPRHVDVAIKPPPVYVIADRPLTDAEWEAEYCETRVLQPPDSKPKLRK